MTEPTGQEIEAALQYCSQELGKVYYGLLFLKAKRQKGELNHANVKKLFKWQDILNALPSERLTIVPRSHPKITALLVKLALLGATSELLRERIDTALQLVDKVHERVPQTPNEARREYRLFEACKRMMQHQLLEDNGGKSA